MGLFKKEKIYQSEYSEVELLDVVSNIQPKQFDYSLFNKNQYVGSMRKETGEFQIMAKSMQIGYRRVLASGKINDGCIKVQFKFNPLFPILIGAGLIFASLSVCFAEKLSVNGISRDATIWMKLGFIGFFTIIGAITLFFMALMYNWIAVNFVKRTLKLQEIQ